MNRRSAASAAVFLALISALAISAVTQLTISPTSLPVDGGLFTVGQAIPQQPFSVTNFPNDPIFWSVSSGNLPPGLTFGPLGFLGALGAPSAALTGTPTQAGAFTFTIQANDETNYFTGTQQYTVFVSLPTSLSLTPASHPPAAAGNFFASSTYTVGGGVPGYTFALQAGTNADGLTLDPNSGQLSGVPQAGGIFPITVVVTDASGAKAVAAFSLNVLGISTGSLPNGAIGTPYLQALVLAPGGTGPFTWSLIGGGNIVLPGLTFTLQGQITGTPTTSGTFPFQVQVTDTGTNVSSTKSFSITIPATLTITTGSLPNGAINVAYPTQTLAASGSPGPFFWVVSSGTLPPGLSLDSSMGAITGTPTQAGTFPFQITATDTTAKLSGTQALSITITGPLTISPATLPSGFIGVPYPSTSGSSTLTVAGATVANWSVTSGALPAGLNLNTSTGAISGTPTAAGTSTFTITASFGVGTAAVPPLVQQFTIVINALNITGLPAVGAAATQPTATIALTGGAYPLTVTGTLTLAFASATGAAQPYDAKFANGSGTTATFTIPAGSTATNIPVMIGTVAGTITITTTSLVDSAGNPLQPPAPFVITVNPTVPVITKVTIGTVTTSGFSISVTGRSTPRDMTSALFHFASPTNTQLASSDVTVAVSSAFTTWYGSSASDSFGSTFTMTVQFTFSGPPGTSVPFTAVTVTMNNSQGASSPFGPVSP